MTRCLICYGGPKSTNRVWVRFASVPRQGEIIRMGRKDLVVRSIVWKVNLDPDSEDAPSDTRVTHYPFIACRETRR